MTDSRKPAKPGIKTTEFWLSLAAFLLSAALASDLIPDAGPWAKIAGFCGAALTAAGYSVGRGIAKFTLPLLACLALALTPGCALVHTNGDKATAIVWFQSVKGFKASVVTTNHMKRAWSFDQTSGDTALAEAIARGAVQGAGKAALP
jgi:hypothetical protein